MKEKLAHIIKNISLKILLAVLSFLLALYIFAAFTHEIFFEKEHELDRRVFRFLADRVPEGTYDLMLFLTFFGKPDFLIPAYIFIIVFFLIRKKKTYAIETAIMAVSSTALLFGLKAIFKRQRPDLPIFDHLPGYSFPSGHALLSFVFCSILIYHVWQSNISPVIKWVFSGLLVIFSLLIGISRIILQVHYTSDVVAGFCLGYAWVLIGLWAQKKLLSKKGEE